jgi:UPF0755 protein
MKRLLLLIVVLCGVTIGWYQWQLQPLDSASANRIRVVIEPGSSVAQIAEQLDEEGVIRSSKAFEWHVRLRSQSLQAGTFLLQPSMSVAELVEILQSGKAEEMIMTIPEGYTLTQIDSLLAQKGLLTEGELVACAQTCDYSSFKFLPDTEGLAERGGKIEGYLYPDTYYVAVADFYPKFFLERMLTAMRHKFLEQYAAEIEQSDRSVHELVTMASLIEEETISDEERAIVAGILWKRYDDGKGLGVDATVRYILNKPTEDITTADLNTNSPYNTRKFRGLPPGPIANPGLKSLLAALRPEKSPYWYYLHDPDGVIHYAVTNEEHNLNRINYLP